MFIQRINVMTAVLAIVIAGTTLLAFRMIVGTAAAQEGKKESDPKAKIEQPAWGTPLNGLRLGLCRTEAKGENKARVMVMLENVGTEDFVLHLGDSFGLGKKHRLSTVRLHLTDTDGRKRVLHPKSPKLVLNDGALITRFVIQLVADSRYVISCDLTDFGDPKDVNAVLPAGRYRATAEFVGHAVTKAKNDTSSAAADLARMHFWTGTIQSDECQVTLPAKTAK
jgi:hypothetical protein